MFSAWDRLPITHKTKPPKIKLSHDKTLVDWVWDILIAKMGVDNVTGYDRDKGTITIELFSGTVHELQFKRIK